IDKSSPGRTARSADYHDDPYIDWSPLDQELKKARDWELTDPITKVLLLMRFWLKLGTDPRPQLLLKRR
ncbi:hypothetical protein ABTM12_19760, partial [Acinetobacter baumannii]